MTKSSLNKLPLNSLFRLDTTSCLPASQPEQAFLHHSIPAWDESGGPVVELGNTIGSNKFLISHACVLVSKLNPRKSRVSVVRDLHGEFPQCASTEFMVYVPIHEDADIGFYSWYMKSECFQSELEKVATGTTNSHVRVTPKETLNWKIAHPPLPEQRRIAEILDTIDEAIQKTEALISKLKAMKQGLLHDLLTRGLDKNNKLRDSKAHPEQFKDSPLGRIPSGWEIHGLDTVCQLSGGYGFPDSFQGSVEGELPFIKVSDMSLPGNERDIVNANNYVSMRIANSMGWKPFPAGTVVFAKVGAALKLNRRRILIKPTLIDNNMMAAIPQGGFDSAFLYHFLRAIDFGDFVQDGALPSVNQEQISSIKIPDINKDEQHRIADTLDAHDARIRIEEQYRDKLKLQKKGLMHDLLTGKVRVKV